MAIDDPRDISDLELWVDINSSGLSKTDGASQSSWTDRSQLGRNLEQDNSSRQPEWNDAETAVEFKGTEHVIGTDTGSGNDFDGWAIAFVIKRNGTDAIAAHETNYGWDLTCNSEDEVMLSQSGDAGVSTTDWSNTDYDLWIINCDGAGIDLYINDDTAAGDESFTVSGVSDNGVYLGGASSHLPMFVRAVCIWKKTLDSSERQDLYDYADGIWLNLDDGDGGDGGDGGSDPSGEEPDAISSELELWCDHRDLLDRSDNATINTWRDRSSEGRDLEESNKPPTWDQNEEALMFTSDGNALVTDTGASTYGNYTLVLCLKRRGGWENGLIFSEGSFGLHVKFNEDNNMRHTQGDDLVDSNGTVSSSSFEIWQIDVEPSADNVQFYRNNDPVGDKTNTTLSSVGDSGVNLGSNVNCESFYIRALLVFKEKLDSTQRQDLWDYGKVAWLGMGSGDPDDPGDEVGEEQEADPNFVEADTHVRSPLVLGGADGVTDPDDLIELELWLDYRDLDGTSDGASVASWSDRSPLSRTVSESHSSLQPEWDDDDKAVVFTEDDHGLQTTDPGNTFEHGYTIALVMKRTQEGQERILAREVSDTFFLMMDNEERLVLSNGGDGAHSRANGSTSSSRFRVWFIVCEPTKQDVRYYINNTLDEEYSNITPAKNGHDDNGIEVGANIACEEHKLRAFCLYKKALSEPELDILHDYATENWLSANATTQNVRPGNDFRQRMLGLSEVYGPEVESHGPDVVSVDETIIARPFIHAPDVQLEGDQPPPVKQFRTHLGSSLFGDHDRFLFPIVVPQNESSMIIRFEDDTGVGTWRQWAHHGNVFYAHRDEELDDEFPSFYLHIERRLNDLTGWDFEFEPMNLSNSGWSKSGLRLRRTSGSGTFGFLFEDEWFVLEQRLFGMPHHDENRNMLMSDDTIEFPCDYYGAWRSPHAASDKRRINMQRAISKSSDREPQPFIVGWEVGQRRHFRYDFIRHAHVFEGRSDDRNLAAEAGITHHGHNAFESLWAEAGDIIVVHDEGDEDLTVTNHDWEVIRLTDQSQTEDFESVIEDVRDGEVYEISFDGYIVDDVDGALYEF